MVEGQGSCEDVEFFELVGAINLNIFSVAFLEERGDVFHFGSLLGQRCLSADFLDLFGLEVFLDFELCDFC